MISQVGKMVGEPSTRADAMALLGIAGKMALRNTPSAVDMLAVSSHVFPWKTLLTFGAVSQHPILFPIRRSLVHR